MFLVGYSLKIFTDNKFKLYLLASLPLAFTPYFAFHSVIGMETILFGALFLASVISYSCFVKKNNKYFLGLAIIFVIPGECSAPAIKTELLICADPLISFHEIGLI